MFDSLRYYCEVVKEGSISAAAKKLHLSQPALSNHIKSLEQSLGTQLLVRNSKGVHPTELGREVLFFAEKFNAMTNTMLEVIARKNNAPQEVIVGADQNVGSYALPGCILQFRKKRPQVKISTKIANTAGTIDRVLEGMVDVGMVEGPVLESHKHLVYKRLAYDRLVFVAANNDYWRQHRKVSMNRLPEECSLICREEGSGTRNTMESMLAKLGMYKDSFPVVLEFNNNEAIKTAVINGEGLSVLPLMAAKYELDSGRLLEIELEEIPAMRYTISLIYNKHRVLSGAAQSFIEFLGEHECI